MVDARRKEAADQAWASCILEGFDPTPEQQALWDSYVNGEISGDEYSQIALSRARENEKNKMAATKNLRVA